MNAITSEARAAMAYAHSYLAPASLLGNVAFARSDLNEWQVEAVEKIAALRNLGPNWNSYGSRPVSDETLNVAMRIVTLANAPDVDTPRVLPLAGGGVQLNWQHGSREVDVEIDRNQVQSLLLSVDDDLTQEMPSINIDQRALRTILDWVYQE